jgi:hypothetical protein
MSLIVKADEQFVLIRNHAKSDFEIAFLMEGDIETAEIWFKATLAKVQKAENKRLRGDKCQDPVRIEDASGTVWWIPAADFLFGAWSMGEIDPDVLHKDNPDHPDYSEGAIHSPGYKKQKARLSVVPFGPDGSDPSAA